MRKVYLSDMPLDKAQQGYMELLRQCGALEPGPPERIPVQEAAGRVTARPVFAAVSSPHYHAAAMDGIAVRAADTFGASDAAPKRLRLGTRAVVVDTGDPLPAECDAVIMIEDVHFVNEEEFEITAAAVPWQHVRAVGEDVVATEMILPANHLLRPYDLGGILAGGVTEVDVHPRPRVALLPTGDELVEPGSALSPGSIIEYNSRMFYAMVEQWGGRPVPMGITPDKYDLLKERLLAALQVADIVLVNAGSSAGRDDYTAALIGELGQVFTHGVAIKPGKPVVLGVVQNKPVIGVPGYPVSAVLGMELFVAPIVYARQGLAVPARPQARVTVSRKIVSSIGVQEFVRLKLGQVGEKLMATPISRGAGMITSMIRADAMLRIPELVEGYQAGEQVDVELLRPLEEVRQTTVIIGSHDLALDIMGSFLRQQDPLASLSSAHVGSLGGLNAIKRGEAHCAGTHLLDEESGDYNVSYIQRLLPGRPVVLVNLVYRQQGLLVARGNPKKISGVRDLARPDVTFVNRQRGAGTRVLLDYLLKQEGLDPSSIQGYQREEYTHMAVAAAVASGAADAGMGILAAARALDLDFIPVGEERYDLCIAGEYWHTPYIQRLLAVMADPAFQAAVRALGGYDLRDCGRVMWSWGVEI